MAEVKIPTVGRQVHYFPNDCDKVAEENGCKVLPATVIQVWGTCINLSVQTFNGDAPVILRSSINHKSSVSKGEDGNPIKGAGRYWDWPEIK